MNKSDTITKLAVALNAFQKAVEGAKKSSDNPYYSSKYADLSEIWKTIREPLTANGLSVTQLPDDAFTDRIDEKNIVLKVAVETVLLHESGEWISSRTVLPIVKRDPQAVGSAITYARRYGLSAILGIHQEDDDANTHTVKHTSQPTQPAVMNSKELYRLLEVKALSDAERQHFTELAEVSVSQGDAYSVDTMIKKLAAKPDKVKAEPQQEPDREQKAKQMISEILSKLETMGKSSAYIRNSVKKHLGIETDEKDWKAILIAAPFDAEKYIDAYKHWKEEVES